MKWVFVPGLILLIFSCNTEKTDQTTQTTVKERQFKLFNTGNIEILLPDSLLERHDLIYDQKDSGVVLAVRTTVGGQYEQNGNIYSYGLVETKYIKDTLAFKNVKIDSVKNNLISNLTRQPGFTLLAMGISKFRGTDVIAYKGRSSNYHIKSVHIPYKHFEFNVSYGGTDSVETNFDKIVNSIVFKAK